MVKEGPCHHCGTRYTPLWRNGPPEKPVLCNACGSRYRSGRSLDNYMPYQTYPVPAPKRKYKRRYASINTSFQNPEPARSSSYSDFQASQEDEADERPGQDPPRWCRIPEQKQSTVETHMPPNIASLHQDLLGIQLLEGPSILSECQDGDLIYNVNSPYLDPDEIGDGCVLLKPDSTPGEQQTRGACSSKVDDKCANHPQFGSSSSKSDLQQEKTKTNQFSDRLYGTNAEELCALSESEVDDIHIDDLNNKTASNKTGPGSFSLKPSSPPGRQNKRDACSSKLKEKLPSHSNYAQFGPSSMSGLQQEKTKTSQFNDIFHGTSGEEHSLLSEYDMHLNKQSASDNTGLGSLLLKPSSPPEGQHKRGVCSSKTDDKLPSHSNYAQSGSSSMFEDLSGLSPEKIRAKQLIGHGLFSILSEYSEDHDDMLLYSGNNQINSTPKEIPHGSLHFNPISPPGEQPRYACSSKVATKVPSSNYTNFRYKDQSSRLSEILKSTSTGECNVDQRSDSSSDRAAN